MPLGWCEDGMLFVELILFLFTAAVTAAGFVSQPTCAPLGLDSRWPLQIPPWGLQHSSPVFPTDNQARSVTGRELHELSSSEHGSSSRRGRKGGLVVLFYLAGDPPSVAITPTFKCLPAFFDEEVQFVMVAYSELSLMSLMSQGLHALPVLQVNAHGRRYRYSGKHWLTPMLEFVSKALGQEPVVGLDVAAFCSSSTHLPRSPSDPPEGTCRIPSLAELHAARQGAAAGTAGRCDRGSMCRGLWQCGRWDGEVTLEELRGQRPAPLFYISVAFLVLRVLWLLQHWVKQRRSRRAPQAAVAAAVAAADAAPAAQTVAQSTAQAASQTHEPGQPAADTPMQGTAPAVDGSSQTS